MSGIICLLELVLKTEDIAWTLYFMMDGGAYRLECANATGLWTVVALRFICASYVLTIDFEKWPVSSPAPMYNIRGL